MLVITRGYLWSHGKAPIGRSPIPTSREESPDVGTAVGGLGSSELGNWTAGETVVTPSPATNGGGYKLIIVTGIMGYSDMIFMGL